MGMTLPPIVSTIDSKNDPIKTDRKSKEAKILLWQVRLYWRFSWRYSTPAILFALLIFSWWQNHCHPDFIFDAPGVSLGISHTRANLTPHGYRCKLIEAISQYIFLARLLSYFARRCHKIYLSICLACLLSVCLSIVCEAPIKCLIPGDGLPHHGGGTPTYET